MWQQPAHILQLLTYLEDCPESPREICRTVNQRMSKHCEWTGDIGAALATACGDPPIAANLQVGLRLACNTFRHAPLRDWVCSNQAALLDAFAPACTSTLKPVRLALATFLLNLSALLYSSPKV